VERGELSGIAGILAVEEVVGFIAVHVGYAMVVRFERIARVKGSMEKF
jgi:hypothetical protein